MTFETAIQRLEEIAAQMENGELPLEQLIVVYEEGSRLIRYCGERLEWAEKRLQTIARDAAGAPTGVTAAEEISPSTARESSVTEAGPTGAGPSSDPVRLF